MPEPPPDRRQHLLERPETRRVARLAVSLLGVSLLASATWGLLALWHLVRRGRLIREQLGPTHAGRLPESEIKLTEQREPEPP